MNIGTFAERERLGLNDVNQQFLTLQEDNVVGSTESLTNPAYYRIRGIVTGRITIEEAVSARTQAGAMFSGVVDGMLRDLIGKNQKAAIGFSELGLDGGTLEDPFILGVYNPETGEITQLENRLVLTKAFYGRHAQYRSQCVRGLRNLNLIG